MRHSLGRQRHQAARKLIEKGESPARVKRGRQSAKREIAGDTVKAIAESWYAQKEEDRSERGHRAALSQIGSVEIRPGATY